MTETKPRPSLSIGLLHRESITVEPRHTVPQVEPHWAGFSEMPPVFATAMMVAFTEETCIQALLPFLDPDQRTVGIHVDMSHVAATPIGLTVTAEVELTEINGRFLTFRATCRDNAGLIGEGTHRRAIIDLARFTAQLEKKTARADP